MDRVITIGHTLTKQGPSHVFFFTVTSKRTYKFKVVICTTASSAQPKITKTKQSLLDLYMLE